MSGKVFLQLLIVVRTYGWFPNREVPVTWDKSDPVLWLLPSIDPVLHVLSDIPDHDPVRERSDLPRLKLVLAERINIEETLARDVLPQAFEVAPPHPLLHPGEV